MPAPVLLAEINSRIENRRSNYQEFADAIDDPDFDYLKLRPIVRDLLPLMDEQVQREVEREIERAEDWETVKSIAVGAATIGLLLLALFPPTSALGVAGVVALEASLAGVAIAGGVEQIQEGLLLGQARGAHDVLDPEQQQAAGIMVAMGMFQVVLGAYGFRNAAVRGLRVRQLRAPAGGGGAGGTSSGAGSIDELEGFAGNNHIKITRISSGEPEVTVTGPGGQRLYQGPLRSMPHSGFGAAAEESAAGAGALNQQQRQIAALQRAAGQQDELAAQWERNAARARDPGTRTDLSARAAGHRAEAARLRSEANDFASGRRSAVEELPGLEDVDALLEGATSPALRGGRPIRIPLHPTERFPATVARLERAVLRTARGRVVFRVEGGGSQQFVTIGPNGEVSIVRGATLNANFGSLERAMEFLRSNRNVPGARIIAFEVDEAFARSLRSAAIPETSATSVPGVRTQLVDVASAPDQLQIPASLVDDLSTHVIPNSGRVLLER
jgi:hypothetical protein